jgi:hypothetical protein
MRGLAKRRIQIAERLFDSYQFGSWNLEGVSHWRVAKTGAAYEAATLPRRRDLAAM